MVGIDDIQVPSGQSLATDQREEVLRRLRLSEANSADSTLAAREAGESELSSTVPKEASIMPNLLLATLSRDQIQRIINCEVVNLHYQLENGARLSVAIFKHELMDGNCTPGQVAS